MAKKYKNNKYFNIYQTGGPVSTDWNSSRVQKIREKVQQARENIGQANVFLDDWNKQRLATGRFNDQLGNGLIDIQKSNRDSTPIYSSPAAYGINSYLRAMPLVKSKDMTDEEAEIKRMNDALQYSRNLRQRILNTTEGGVQGSVLGEYNPKAKTIYANPEGGESTLLHEQTHASQATPQENKISEILGTSNTSGTYYYDRPTEVYSRLMQFRQANNLDPNEIITKDKLKEFKKSATDFDLLFRYKDKELLDLFNNVASVDTPLNNDINYAAYGGRVNKFNLGGPVKAWNTSPNIPNKLTTPLGNSPITNTLSGGQKLTTKLGLGSNFMGNLGSSITGFLGSGQGLNMASNAVFGLLNPNGNSTGVGNAMQTIGGLASNIPGVGGIAGAAIGAVGGLVNAAFGSKINEENVAQFRAQNQQQANYTSNASTNEELLADFGSMQHLGNVAKKDVGSDGWFSNKAKNLTRDINAERQRANLSAITSLGNTAQTVDTTNDLLKGYNFSAYGGPIDMKYTGIMSPFGNQFKDGGIYIKPENKGKFTALKERTGKSATWFKEHGTPAQKKMATFALNARKWKHDNGGPLFDFNNLKRDDYGLLNYNGSPILSSKYSSRRASEDKSTRRNTPLGYLVGDENQNVANLIWGSMELLPVVGNVMGISDVANDVYNMANSDNISSDDFGNLLLDIGGLVPGVSTITKGSKLAKAAKLSKAASKLDDAADALRYTSSKGVNDIKKRVKDAKDFAQKSLEEATKAALSRNKEDLYKASMRAREAAKFNEGILNGVDKALDPFWTRYNVYQNVGTKADALNDIFGFMGSVEDNVKAFGGELNARKWKYEDGGPLEELTPQERLNIALGRTPSGRPLEQGLINVYPEMMFMPSGNLNTVGNITGNLGLSFGKKAAVKSLRGLEYVIRNTDKLKKKVDNTVYDVIDDITEAAIEGVPELSNVLNKASKTTKKAYKRFKDSKLVPSLFQDEDNEIVNNENMYKTSLGEGHEDYAFGGELTHGGIFSNGIQEINNGGTHEQNPYEGIQVGVDEQNIPNLVEEGELIWNDYVFSNRLNVPKSVRQKYKLRNTKNLKFAEAAKELQKESEERPNDPISKNGLNAALSDLANEQEYIRMKKEQRQNTFAYGGSKGNIFEGEGDKPQKLKSYKNYEKLYNDNFYNTFGYIPFWNWMSKNKNSEEAKKWLGRINSGEFGNIGGNTFNMDDILRLSHDYKRGPVHNAFLAASRKYVDENPILGLQYDTSIKTPEKLVPVEAYMPPSKQEEEGPLTFKESPLRYAPIAGHFAGVVNDLFSKPDYQAADEVRNIELNPSLVGFTPIGNKLRFTPYDINFQINKANANAGASRRNIMNTSGGNRAAAMAGLMGVDTNYYNALGDAYRQALQYNDARREAVETFNRTTDQFNSEMGLKASIANAESRNAMTKARYERDKAAALLGQQARDAYNTRLSNNLNILLEDIGNLGKERNFRNWADVLASRGVIKMNSKGEHQGKKNGGKLNRKKKGGWEYA